MLPHSVPTFRKAFAQHKITAFNYIRKEPVGTKSPAVPADEKWSRIERRRGHTINMFCTAQGYPAPSFRLVLSFVSKARRGRVVPPFPTITRHFRCGVLDKLVNISPSRRAGRHQIADTVQRRQMDGHRAAHRARVQFAVSGPGLSGAEFSVSWVSSIVFPRGVLSQMAGRAFLSFCVG